MDISMKYLGLTLKNPIIASSSPLTRTLDGIKRLEDAGVAAVVLPSLFEEQIEQEIYRLETSIDTIAGSHNEATSYFPPIETTHAGPDEYLKTIYDSKQHVNIPVIASLNGAWGGGWTRYAAMIQNSGADAIELNIYYMTTDLLRTSHEVEETYLSVIESVCHSIKIPVTVKIGPYFSSLPNMVKRITQAGAKGITLFNRFYQPDINIETLEVEPTLKLSSSDELRLPLRWIAILYGRITADLAITTGVHTSSDIIKSVLAGANVTMMASELLQFGPERICEILCEIENWMTEHEYESVNQMRGSVSQVNVQDPDSFERANYIKILDSFKYSPISLPR